MPNQTAPELEKQILEMTEPFPTYSYLRLSEQLRLVGIGASPAAVRGVWQRHGLVVRYQRLLWLERKTAAGQRVRKIAGSTTTEYIYDLGGNVVAERVGTTWTRGYVYLNGQLVAQYSNGTTYFVHRDHLGSTRVLTRVDKSVHETYDFLPYGESNSCTGANATPRCFTGHPRDPESGLDYFGARYYASLAGRFQSADLPFVDQHPASPQSWNLYAYARNNPLLFVDPTGNYTVSEHAKHETRPMEGGDAMNSFGNSTCMACEEYETDASIADAFAPFDALAQAAQQSQAPKPQQRSGYPSAEDLAAGNFISVTSRPLESHWTAHIPAHHRISIPIVVDGKWTGGYDHYEILGDEGTRANQQLRRNDTRRIRGSFSGRLVAVRPEQRQALVQRLTYFLGNPGTCPVCGPRYHLTRNNSNTFVFNMLIQNPAGRIKPPRPMHLWSPGFKESKDRYY